MSLGGLDQPGPHRPRGDGVHPDVPVRIVERRRLGQLVHPRLGRAIDAVVLPADHARGRGGVDDRAPAGPQHRGDAVLHAQERAAQVGGVDFVPGLHRLLVQRRHRPAEAGVVAQDVEPAEFALGGGDHLHGLRLVGNVAVDRHRVGADGRSHRVLVAADVGEHQLRALGGEQLGHRPAHARSGAGDDGDLALQPSCHVLLLPLRPWCRSSGAPRSPRCSHGAAATA